MGFCLAELIEVIDCMGSQEKENLLIVSLFMECQDNESIPYMLFEEAFLAGELEIGEVSEEGSVNTITILNKADKAVLILDGEEVLGAKQNRMVNATILIPPRNRTEVPVSCVERGRWHYSSPVFDRVGAFGYSTLRRQKAEQVFSNLECEGVFAADQCAIWEEIDRKQAGMGISSPTDALHEVYQNYEEELENLTSGLKPVPGQVGVAVFINGRFTCLDLFDRWETLEKMWNKLLKSYAMEALEVKEEKKSSVKPDIQAILSTIGKGEISTYPSPGLGKDLRFHGPGFMGAALVLGDRPLHVAIFGGGEEKARSGRMGSPGRRRNNLRQQL